MSTAHPPDPDGALAQLPITTISSDPRSRLIQALRDLVGYQELFFAFVIRDLKVRYKQTFFGVIWVVLQPLITGVVFAAVFGLIRGQFNGTQDLLFFMAGLVPWSSFQQGTQMAAQSLEQNANLIAKIYFPRLTVPSARVIASLVDFLIAFSTLIVIAILAGAFDPRLILFMVPLLLIQLTTALGLGIGLSILNAQYRDVKYAIPFLLQLAMFVTVLIPLEGWRAGDVGLGPQWDWLSPYAHMILSFNPMAAVVETYRALLLDGPINGILLAKGTLVSLVLLFLGVRFFVAREKRLVDIL